MRLLNNPRAASKSKSSNRSAAVRASRETIRARAAADCRSANVTGKHWKTTPPVEQQRFYQPPSRKERKAIFWRSFCRNFASLAPIGCVAFLEPDNRTNELARTVVDAAFQVHTTLGP